MKPLPIWHPASLFATFFCVGKVPFAPGTFGSLAAFPFFWVILQLINHFYPIDYVNPMGRILGMYGVWAAILVILFIIGCWAGHIYAAESGDDDPSAVVIDEVVGQGLVLLLTTPILVLSPASLPLLVIVFISSFILFRIFDIKKPWPVDWCDKNIKGGFGIMFDDIVAAVMAAVTFYIGWLIYQDFISAAAKHAH